ncbi:MAG: MSMEG_0570 family nitrogen starvation response protein [Polyangiaceae bacterium]|jgi:uncharacterized repeat protein (TIGR04042 family)
MPEMHFVIEWPSGDTERCYSPSYVIEQHLTVGGSYTVDDFLERASRSLWIASERVRARYGMACTAALDQLARLEAAAGSLLPGHRGGRVRVLAFEKHPPRDAR